MKKRIAWSLIAGALAFAVISGISILCQQFYWFSGLILAGCGFFVISVAVFMTMNPSVKKEQ